MAGYRGGGSSSPTGAAGGDLSGTYPDPSIASGAVAITELASIASDRLVGRDTAGTGAPEVLTVGGGLEFTGSGGIQRSALTGDVTASAGSGTTTVAAVAGVTPGAGGLAVLDDADASAIRATLDLEPGTDIASLSGGYVPVGQLGSGSPTAGMYLSGAGSWESGGLVPSAIVQGAPLEQAWSTGVAVTVDLGTLQDGDYSVRVWHWIERTAGGAAASREATWNAALRRTGGVLSLLGGSWTSSTTGAYAPTVTWAVSGDDVTVTVTSSGSSGRISTQTTLVYRGDLTS